MPQNTWHSTGDSGAWFATRAEAKAYERGRTGGGHEGPYPEGHPEDGGPSRDGPYGREPRGKRGKGGKGRGKGHQPQSQGWGQQASHSWGGGGGGGRNWPQAPQPASVFGLVTGAAMTARCVVEAARDLKYLAGPQPAVQGQANGPEPGKGWLAQARDWVMGVGGSSPPAQGSGTQLALTAGAAPAQVATTPAPAQQGALSSDEKVQLLHQLLGTQAPARSQDGPQAGDVATLKAQVEAQNKLLQDLHARLASPASSSGTAAPPPPAALPAPAAPPAQQALTDATNAYLLEELVQQRVALAKLAAKAEEGGKPKVDDPARAPAGVLPTRASLDPEGEVTTDGHDEFWAWLDNTPAAPWPCTGTFSAWVDKMVYKCKAEEIREWARAKGVLPGAEQAPPGSTPTRKELLVLLAKASVAHRTAADAAVPAAAAAAGA